MIFMLVSPARTCEPSSELCTVCGVVPAFAGQAELQQSVQVVTKIAENHNIMKLLRTLMPRWLARNAAPSSLMSRTEVCPPELFPSSVTLSGRLKRWWRGTQRPVNRLNQVKNEFRLSLDDLLPRHPDTTSASRRRCRCCRACRRSGWRGWRRAASSSA
ncbi:MAG: hypothetical protein HY021_01440 [Burkholderiales bacterium]|nr:hypothetical protein [Burkholderiales bacterium]